MQKKQKIKQSKNFRFIKDKKNRVFISILISLSLTFGVVFAADILADTLNFQTSSSTGSNNSKISVSRPGKPTEYINAGNNSTIIGNYLKGYYYDSVFGYFKLDWSADKMQNVRIVSSTSKCTSGYGYKLGGKAKGMFKVGTLDHFSAGYIDFDHNSSTFVYYCEYDKKLHGKGYSRWIGYQNFEGIRFEIIADGTSTTIFTGATDIFVNDNTTIVDTVNIFTGSNSNASIDTLLGDQFKFDTNEESIFYIIK